MDTLTRLLSIKPNRQPIRLKYGSDPLCFGDLWIPSNPGPHPVAIVVHGGFWFNAYDLNLMNHMSNAFADAGIAAWNIEYRRIGDAGGAWPGTFLDNALATEYVAETWCAAYIGHSVDVPFAPCMLVGFFTGEILIPAALFLHPFH